MKTTKQNFMDLKICIAEHLQCVGILLVGQLKCLYCYLRLLSLRVLVEPAERLKG